MYTKKGIRFDPKNPPHVSNELIVILDEPAQSNVSNMIPSGPARRFGFNMPSSLGVSNIDTVLKRHNCVSINKIHGVIPESRTSISSVSMSNAKEMHRTYRMRFDVKKSSDIKKICTSVSKLKGVKKAELNHYNFAMAVTPNDPKYPNQWGLPKMKLPEAWEHTKGDSSIVVAVLDSGVDLNHPDLVDNLVNGNDLVDLTPLNMDAGDILPISGDNYLIEGDVLTVDNTPQDDVGHGTHVAGTVAASSNNNVGVTGVAWNCSIMPVRSLFRVRRLSDNFVTGIGTDADIAAGINWAASNGAHIINMSLGGPASTAKQNAINFAISQGCLCVAAMGNDNSSTPSFPAAYAGVLAVGAVDSNDNRAIFSNFGPHISVVAPGVNIWSTYWDDTYSSLSGTSMATPHVAGLAALILSCDNSLSASQVKTIIEETAVSLKDQSSDPVPNDNYGYGLVDAEAALQRVCDKVTSPIKDVITRMPETITKPWLDVIPTKPWLDIRPTRPWLDIRPTIPWLDIRPTRPWTDLITNPRIDQIETHPSLDHHKRVELDKSPVTDRIGNPRDIAPFVLSTPHHYEGAHEQYETNIDEIFAQARSAYENGELTKEDIAILDQLYEQYYGTQ